MPTDQTQIVNELTQLYSSIGRAAVSNLFPNDFEYYAVALELTDFDGFMVDYFLFPVMPKGISKTETSRANIKKTYNSTTVLNSKTFSPCDISIKGTFGRAFKIVIDADTMGLFRGFKYSRKSGVWFTPDLDQSSLQAKAAASFNPIVKTGFGCLQILRSIISKASGTDDKGRPFKLFLYLPALSEAYLVAPTPNPLTLTMDEGSTNMIWQYQLNLTAIAPLSGNLSQGKIGSSCVNVLALASIQKATTAFVSTLSHLL